jgi:outer membrane protein TolC
MGSQERNRRRQIIVAIISMTLPLPLNQVRAWEPVHVDRTHLNAKAAPTASTPGATLQALNVAAPAATGNRATSSNENAANSATNSATFPIPAAGNGLTNTSLTAKAQPSKVVPVVIEESGATKPQTLDEFEESLSGPWAPVKTASRSGRKAIDPIQIEDPARGVDATVHADWSGPKPALPALATQPPAPNTSAAPSAGTAKGPFKPIIIKDHFAAGDRLEMIGGDGTATAPTLTSIAPAPSMPVPPSEAAPPTVPSSISASLPASELAANKAAQGISMPEVPTPLINRSDEPGATALASASLIQNTQKPRNTAPNGEQPLPAPAGQTTEGALPQPLVADNATPQIVTLSRVEALELALQRNPNVRVLAKTPQIVNTDLTTQDAFFDPFFNASVIGSKQDQQLTDTLQSFGGTFNTNQRDALLPLGSINNLSIGQQLRGGGEYEVGVGTMYEHFDRVGAFRLVNPAWLSSVNLHFEQPLFEGRGRAIGESLIEIARINNRQSTEEFRAEVNTILRDAEIAYWSLALLEQQAIVYRTIIEKSEKQLTGETDRLDLGDSILPDVLESRDQYTEFLTIAASIETQRRNAAQQLANVLGYTPDQAALLRTNESERPLTELPNFEEGIARLMLRPELEAQRSAIRRSEVELRRQINTLQPDLRMVVDYAITGLDEDLAGSMETVVDNDFHYAALGFVLQQPIGRRAEFAQVRRANLTLCQERERLEALQHQYTHQLQGIYSQLQAQAEVIRLAQDRVAIAQEQYTLRLTLRNEGEGDLDSVLRTQQRLSIAQTNANDAIYRYQQLLVQWQYEQGAIGDERIAISQ